jgi:hypothetical protein
MTLIPKARLIFALILPALLAVTPVLQARRHHRESSGAWIYDNAISLGLKANVPGNGWLDLQYEKAVRLRNSALLRAGGNPTALTAGAAFRFWFSNGPSLTQWFIGPAADVAFSGGNNAARGGLEFGYQHIWPNKLMVTPNAGVYFNPGGLQLGIGLSFGLGWGN